MNIRNFILSLAFMLGAGSLCALADYVTVNADTDEANVYVSKSTKSDVLGTLKAGVQGELLGESEHFFQIKQEDGQIGYVLKSKTARIYVSEETGSASATDATDLVASEAGPVEAEAASAETEADAAQLDAAPSSDVATFPCGKTKVTVGKKTYDVADIYDVRTIYKSEGVNKANCFFVISKQEYRLYVYEKVASDTILVAHYPVCYAKRTGQKTKSGDMSTPEGDMQNYFTISQIQDASTWKHDFKDGRGSIKAYGDWFMRLNLNKATNLNAATRSNRSIGIHGSSGNRESVPGNDSEGCIRLRDEDISHLKSHFAQVGTKVVVKPVNKGKYAFEKKAQKKLGDKYFCAKKGYRKYPSPAKK